MWVFSGLCYALPNPTADSSAFYVFIYKVIQFIGANLARAGFASHPAPIEEQPRVATKAA